MDNLIKTDNKLTEQENEKNEIIYKKVLNIGSSTFYIDFKGAINKVLQYVDLTSLLHNIKKGTEYVVQIPAELQGGFQTGKYWIMENSKTGTQWPTLMELSADGREKLLLRFQ